jgi:hypothetical protein
MKSIYLHIFSLTLLLSSSNIFPQWSNNPNQNLQISNFGYFVSACEDGMGGAFVGWTTANDPAPTSWLQWVDKYGYVRWSQPLHITGNGVAQTQLKLIKSESGKVILTFLDCIEVGWDSVFWGPILHTYLRANKIDTTGFLHWGERGITVTEDTAFTDEIYGVTEDEDYGIYATWSNVYPPPYIGFEDTTVIRVQKISNQGERQWGKTGNYISTWYGYNSPDPYLSRRKPDGIFLRYQKQNVGNTLSSINPDMSVRWAKINDWYWDIIPDENGGGAWAGRIVNTGTLFQRIIANKIDEEGNLMWGDSGLVIANYLEQYDNVRYSKFLENKFIILWVKNTNSNPFTMKTYIQIINESGIPLFPDSSILITQQEGSILPSALVVSDSGNFIITWRNNENFYSQKFDEAMNQLWSSEILYSTSEHIAIATITDGRSGFIETYGKYYPTPIGVFMQQVSRNGNLGEVITSIYDDENNNDYNFILNQNYPNPFNSQTIINFELNQSEDIELNIYNCLGENVRNLFVGAEEKGHHSMKWDGKDKNNFNLSSGIYFIELKTSFGHTQIIKTVLLK